MTTETLDKIYLEWSQLTKARTAREIKLESALRRIIEEVSPAANNGATGAIEVRKMARAGLAD